MKEICLYNLTQTGIVILSGAGITYYNQTGGAACMQSRATGYFVPISNDPPLDQPELDLSLRLGSLLKDVTGLTVDDSRKINDLLLEVSSSDRYCVNDNRLNESQEAWVHIKVVPGGDYSQFTGFDEFDAVLTWPNSD